MLMPEDAPKNAPPTETDEIKGDNRILTKVVAKRIKTLKDLIEVCEIDSDEWEIERYVVNKWESAAIPRSTRDSEHEGWVRPNTKPTVTQLFQVKAWMKLRRHIITAKEEIKALIQKAENFAPKYPALIFKNRNESGNLGEFSFHDHHFGSLIWGRETGGADYDTAIAKRAYEDALTTLLGRVKGYGLDKAMIVFGSDQLNSDNLEGLTTKGTPQDNDSRFHKVFSISRDVSIWAIEALCSVVPQVEAIVIPGNHDTLSSFLLGSALQAWFRNSKNVTIDNEPTHRKYKQHGTCFLMFTHGNAGKLENYPQIMAAEQPALWGRTLYREAHTGDKHRKQLIELPGATVRILPSLRPPDAWCAENHFVGSIRAAEAYVWNDREGLIGTGVYSILANKEQDAESRNTKRK